MPKGGDSAERDTAKLLVSSRTDVPTFETERFKKSMEDASMLMETNKKIEEAEKKKFADAHILENTFGVSDGLAELNKNTSKIQVAEVKWVNAKHPVDKLMNARPQEQIGVVDSSIYESMKTPLQWALANNVQTANILATWSKGDTPKPAEAIDQLKKLISALPSWMQNMLKWFLDFFKKLANGLTPGEAKKYVGKFLKDSPAIQGNLEKYGVAITDKKDGGAELKFPKDAKIAGAKLDATQLSKPDNSNEVPKKIDIKDGDISLPEWAKVASVIEGANGITIIVNGKDGSRDTYNISNIKKSDAPVATPENQLS